MPWCPSSFDQYNATAVLKRFVAHNSGAGLPKKSCFPQLSVMRLLGTPLNGRIAGDYYKPVQFESKELTELSTDVPTSAWLALWWREK
jgi:hypothetical protein